MVLPVLLLAVGVVADWFGWVVVALASCFWVLGALVVAVRSEVWGLFCRWARAQLELRVVCC